VKTLIEPTFHFKLMNTARPEAYPGLGGFHPETSVRQRPAALQSPPLQAAWHWRSLAGIWMSEGRNIVPLRTVSAGMLSAPVKKSKSFRTSLKRLN